MTLTARITTADGQPTPSAVGLTLRTVHEWGGANPASPNIAYQAFGQAGAGPVWFSLPAGMASGATASASVLLGNDGWAEADEWFQFRIAPAAASVVPVQLVWIADDDCAGARDTGECGTRDGGARPLGYQGKPHDPKTCLDDFGARDYRAAIGRFQTGDPVLPVDRALRDPHWLASTGMPSRMTRLPSICFAVLQAQLGDISAACTALADVERKALGAWKARAQEVAARIGCTPVPFR